MSIFLSAPSLLTPLQDVARQCLLPRHVLGSWGPGGDCFIIKAHSDTVCVILAYSPLPQDMTKFTITRMFKPSNFASFVLQLNKYDFHKVKNSEENMFGDHSWTFHHPDFQANHRDAQVQSPVSAQIGCPKNCCHKQCH